MKTRRYDGRFYKTVGGFLYLVFCNGRWHFVPGKSAGMDYHAREAMGEVFAEMKAQGVVPHRVACPRALNMAASKRRADGQRTGMTLEAWKSLPRLEIHDGR